VVVLDTTTAFWASMGAALLADFGARVIRIEGLLAPLTGGGLTDTLHHYELANRNKRASRSIATPRPRGLER
jgi:crotonobetainyl-CoA:carnitine CoA-transferase CaiB-like acyl-CoA transferase